MVSRFQQGQSGYRKHNIFFRPKLVASTIHAMIVNNSVAKRVFSYILSRHCLLMLLTHDRSRIFCLLECVSGDDVVVFTVNMDMSWEDLTVG